MSKFGPDARDCSPGAGGYAAGYGLAEISGSERGGNHVGVVLLGSVGTAKVAASAGEPRGRVRLLRRRFGPAGTRIDRARSARRAAPSDSPMSVMLPSLQSKSRVPGFVWALLWILVVWTGVLSVAGADETAESQGRELAQRLRTVAPEDPSTNQAVLRIRNREGRRQIPVTVVTQPGKGRWTVEYQVGGPGAKGAGEISRIHYSAGGTPTFEVVVEGLGKPPIQGGRAPGDWAIAKSDFLLHELGMEFLHWPEQRVSGRELSNGRWCQVLESVSKKPEGPASVRSWIDEKLGVVLSAEVYDARKVRLKHFSITQFREQADRWTCSVSMVDDVRGTKTELAFDGPVPR